MPVSLTFQRPVNATFCLPLEIYSLTLSLYIPLNDQNLIFVPEAMLTNTAMTSAMT